MAKAPNREAFDPEVQVLVTQVRALVTEAYRLSQDIEKAMNDIASHAGLRKSGKDPQ